MFRHPPSGRPPPPFYPASQQQQSNTQAPSMPSLRSRAVPIVAPAAAGTGTEQSEDAEATRTAPSPSASSPYTGLRTASALGGGGGSSSSSGALPGDSTSSSPMKGALSARAAAAAVFVPKSAAAQTSSSSSSYEYGSSAPEPDDLRTSGTGQVPEDISFEQPPAHGSFNTYNSGPQVGIYPHNNESGRGTPNSFGLSGGYDTDGMNSAFDPTYMGPITSNQEYMPGPATPSTGSAPTGAAHSSRGSTRVFNPYEHMNEFGEPSSGPGINGMPTQGLDYYGTPGRGLGIGVGGAGGGAGGGSGGSGAVGGGGGGHSGASAMGAGGAPGHAKVRQPLQYHLYNPPLPHVSNLHPQHLSAHAFFLSPDHREELQRKNDAIYANAARPEFGGPSLPDELHVYHSLVPLEPSTTSGGPLGGLVSQLIDPRVTPPTAPGNVLQLTGGAGMISKVFGLRTYVYKATCNLDGKAYVLRRLADYRLSHEAAIGLVENWRKIRHPSITSVREAFTTRAFGDHSLVFVYDYHPLATTLYGEHMVPKPPQPDPRTGRMQSMHMHISERTLWSYACQLTNAIRCIHQHGMAARCIEPSKVLRTGKNRVRINCCSIFDVLTYDPNANQQQGRQTQQSEDLFDLGRLLVSLACNSMTTVTQQNVSKSIEQISRTYSSEFKKLVVWLLAKPTQQTQKTAEELTRLLAAHMADEIDSALNYSDLLDSALTKELENARLVRLLCKFGFINERPEFDHDPRWSETGDRYVIKLFRDFVFHAIDEAGRPVVDLSHILTNLNKLDAGSEERIVLTSRDEQSCLVVSFGEIKACIESAFQDLTRPR